MPAKKIRLEDLATKKQVEELAVATKEQIKGLATKEQLGELAVATKEQVEELAVATKAQIEELATDTKHQIEELAVATANEFAAVRSEMVTKTEFREAMKEIARSFDGLESHISAEQGQWRDDFDDHEGRIRTLEKKHRAV